MASRWLRAVLCTHVGTRRMRAEDNLTADDARDVSVEVRGRDGGGRVVCGGEDGDGVRRG